jgi:hypothetical protein
MNISGYFANHVFIISMPATLKWATGSIKLIESGQFNKKH